MGEDACCPNCPTALRKQQERCSGVKTIYLVHILLSSQVKGDGRWKNHAKEIKYLYWLRVKTTSMICAHDHLISCHMSQLIKARVKVAVTGFDIFGRRWQLKLSFQYFREERELKLKFSFMGHWKYILVLFFFFLLMLSKVCPRLYFIQQLLFCFFNMHSFQFFDRFSWLNYWVKVLGMHWSIKSLMSVSFVVTSFLYEWLFSFCSGYLEPDCMNACYLLRSFCCLSRSFFFRFINVQFQIFVNFLL